MSTLATLFCVYGTPKRIRSDNGSEFIAKELHKYFAENDLKALHVAPGSPWQNGYVESFNNKSRDDYD